jgi:hypothetical protein
MVVVVVVYRRAWCDRMESEIVVLPLRRNPMMMRGRRKTW